MQALNKFSMQALNTEQVCEKVVRDRAVGKMLSLKLRRRNFAFERVTIHSCKIAIPKMSTKLDFQTLA